MNLKYLFIIIIIILQLNCKKKTEDPVYIFKVRSLVDTIGYANTAVKMDSLIRRIDRASARERQNILNIQNVDQDRGWQLVICPHDDYSYAGYIYPYVFQNISTPIIFIFGVAHSARKNNIENQLIFDSFTHWKGIYGNIPVSSLREKIIEELQQDYFQINDSLQQAEHSIEALLPFIQYYNRNMEIVPILVADMNYSHMQKISMSLCDALIKVTKQYNLIWGKDFLMAVSNDCVHYGDQNWNGKNLAPFGADTAGYHAATNFDMNIISECLIDGLDPQRIRRFFEYTVMKDNFKEYAWTWCGRYSVPFGLLTAYYLQQKTKNTQLFGYMLRYSTSIAQEQIDVSDLNMGVTSPANIHHWVGYVAIGYK